MNSTDLFLRARDFLMENREDYFKAYQEFRWPEIENFNWALDWFDVYARNNRQTALHILQTNGLEQRRSFADLSDRSHRIAAYFQKAGIQPGDRILMMLPNVPALWEIILAAMKVKAVLVLSSVLLTAQDLADRIQRASVSWVVADESAAEKFENVQGTFRRIYVGGHKKDWISYEDLLATSADFVPPQLTRRTDPLLLYFTSGTTAKPKIVLHTHQSYPIGHLSSLYWIGLKEGDVHQNISSPGWAKHAYSSFFVPWTAGATILVHDYSRFNAKETLRLLDHRSVNSLCAPPTVWRMLILKSLGQRPCALRELVSAGEPLNPEVIQKVSDAWGLMIRDGYGQTETTLQIGNSPGQPIRLGSMGRPMPGYQVALINNDARETAEGEVALRLNARPLGLMASYLDDSVRSDQVLGGAYYRTGDEATRDADGYYWFVGRGDDVFKSSDYRISPFELESVLIEHEAVAEAAVVPSPDPVRLSVPKAFVALKPGFSGDAVAAADILSWVNSRLAPYQKIRRLEFAELPKTVSGKIRRVELRASERENRSQGVSLPGEYRLEEL